MSVKEKSESIYASIDDGATVSIIDLSVVERLSAPKIETNICIKGIAGNKALLKPNYKSNLHVKVHSELFAINNILVVNQIPLSRQIINKSITKLCTEQTGIHVEPLDAIPLILIGQDNCRLILTREVRGISKYNLVVSRCLLGWSIHGHFGDFPKSIANVCNVRTENKLSRNRVSSRNDKKLHDLVVK